MMKKLKNILGEIRREKFDAVFDLSLGREYGFFLMLAGIRERIGFDFKGRGIFLTRKKRINGYAGRPVALEQLGLLDFWGISYSQSPYAIPIEISKKTEHEVELFLTQSGFKNGLPIVAVAPGGGRSWGSNARFKQWDPERFASAVNRFSEQTSCCAVLLGDRTEARLLEETAKSLKVPFLLFCHESMEKVCGILKRASFFLGNDGGLLHLAAALGVKTVSIFGPVDETVYGVYAQGTHIVLTENVPCRPCYANFHFPPCPYERRCLDHLAVDKAVDALGEILLYSKMFKG